MANVLLYGFEALAAKDLLNQRANQVPEVQAAIEISVGEHNRMVSEYIGTFARSTTDYTARFRSNAAGILQPLDEYGRSKPTKSSTYSVAWPIKMAGAATGFTFVSREKVTVKEVNDGLSTILMSDVRWIRRQILGALFDNTASGRTFADDIYGNLTIFGLANNDATPAYYNQLTDTEAADNHYLAQASAIDDSNNPFSTIYTEITEHPENSGDVVSLIASDLKATVTALAEFIPVTDPNVILGATADRTSTFPTGSLPPDCLPLGYLSDSKIWVAEWRILPSTYIVTKMTGGDDPLAFRQDPEGSLQGFRAIERMDEFPYYGEQWIRRGGFAGWNRLGAVVMRIGNSSYAIPSGFSLVMAS